MIDFLNSRGFMANITKAGRDPEYRRNWRSVWVWCLALSLAVHLALLMVLPGSSETRSTFNVRVMDVVLMPATPVPPPAAQRNTNDAAKKAQAPARRERTPEPRPAPVAMQHKSQGVHAAEPAPVPEPHEVAGTPAKSNADHPEISHKAQMVEPGHIPNEVTAPSFNAALLRNPAPGYPIVARRNGEQGTVTIKVLVARDGTPANVSVDKTSGYARLDNAALETVRLWRFAPARQGAQPMEAWVLVPIVFRLEPVS